MLLWVRSSPTFWNFFWVRTKLNFLTLLVCRASAENHLRVIRPLCVSRPQSAQLQTRETANETHREAGEVSYPGGVWLQLGRGTLHSFKRLHQFALDKIKARYTHALATLLGACELAYMTNTYMVNVTCRQLVKTRAGTRDGKRMQNTVGTLSCVIWFPLSITH